MKKKIKFGNFKIKLSWKKSFFSSILKNITKSNQFKLKLPTISSPKDLLEQKIYKIFKKDFCEFIFMKQKTCYSVAG